MPTLALHPLTNVSDRRPRRSRREPAAPMATLRKRARPLPIGGMRKRFLDIAISGAALVAASPLIGAAALMMKLSDGGPLFYGHTRVGRHGTPFRCYKIRTMAVDGERILAQHLASHPAAAAEWESTRKLRDDPRVGFIGNLLRRTSIDELPQLMNVLCGEMSIVGPRPVTEEELSRYGMRALHYLRSRPGLTGPWQVSGRSDVGYRRRVALDAHYVRRWSMGRDIAILAATIPAVVASRGSY